ncbi:hypothetical protein EB796_001512 [Bugula neritina]|uniref:Uncharacterized protein n=1 Tax=Bugula neritina TaxID=10212 RepID=A0A7J7KPT5_BUGNE|nr:hypothetical protein EB796_001512 [Bugula neritina]
MGIGFIPPNPNPDSQLTVEVIAVLFGIPSAIAFVVGVILLILLIRRKLLGNSHGSKDDIREHLVEVHVSSTSIVAEEMNSNLSTSSYSLDIYTPKLSSIDSKSPSISQTSCMTHSTSELSNAGPQPLTQNVTSAFQHHSSSLSSLDIYSIALPQKVSST